VQARLPFRIAIGGEKEESGEAPESTGAVSTTWRRVYTCQSGRDRRCLGL